MDERCCAAEPLTIQRRIWLAHGRFRSWSYMKWHGFYWRVLWLTGLGWTYSMAMCRWNLYQKFPDGRCMYCGKKHGA